MAKTMAAFYEIPPWFEGINQLHRQMDSLTRALSEVQTNYSALNYTSLAKSISATLDSPAICNLKGLVKVFVGSQSMTTMSRTLEIAAKIDTPGMIAALRQYQAAIDTIVPTELQVQLSKNLPEWSHILSKATYQIKPLTEISLAELTRLSSLAEECSSIGVVEEPRVLSDDEQRIVATEVDSILLSGENWEQHFAERIKSFSQTHPVIAWVLEKIFFAILISTAANIISSAIGQTLFPAKVYEDSCSSSQVIHHIDQNQDVIVVGEVPYYYEIVVNNESSGVRYTGYVSKRSIRLTESKDNPAEGVVK